MSTTRTLFFFLIFLPKKGCSRLLPTEKSSPALEKPLNWRHHAFPAPCVSGSMRFRLQFCLRLCNTGSWWLINCCQFRVFRRLLVWHLNSLAAAGRVYLLLGWKAPSLPMAALWSKGRRTESRLSKELLTWPYCISRFWSALESLDKSILTDPELCRFVKSIQIRI